MPAFAAVRFTGATGAVLGTPVNCRVTRSSPGSYTINWTTNPPPDNKYTILVTGGTANPTNGFPMSWECTKQFLQPSLNQATLKHYQVYSGNTAELTDPSEVNVVFIHKDMPSNPALRPIAQGLIAADGTGTGLVNCTTSRGTDGLFIITFTPTLANENYKVSITPEYPSSTVWPLSPYLRAHSTMTCLFSTFTKSGSAYNNIRNIAHNFVVYP